MARKSRKTHRVGTNEVANTPVKEQKKVATAIYCRLSKADEITGRESMESQRNILLQFVEKKEELEVEIPKEAIEEILKVVSERLQKENEKMAKEMVGMILGKGPLGTMGS